MSKSLPYFVFVCMNLLVLIVTSSVLYISSGWSFSLFDLVISLGMILLMFFIYEAGEFGILLNKYLLIFYTWIWLQVWVKNIDIKNISNVTLLIFICLVLTDKLSVFFTLTPEVGQFIQLMVFGFLSSMIFLINYLTRSS